MTFHAITVQNTLKHFNSDKSQGLNNSLVELSRKQNGVNTLSQKSPRSFLCRVFDALKEPMLLILLFGLVLTLGTNIGKALKSGEGDFSECIGILFAIVLSVSITLIMEGSSQKAFKALNKIYDNITVKVVRNGVTVSIPQYHVVVGDIIILDGGDKIVADGRLIESIDLTVDESSLTGESVPSKKRADVVLTQSTPLAERINCVFSGTFITTGSGKMIVTAVGDDTEIGSVAGELNDKNVQTPLQQKLGKLGKTVTIIGAVTAATVFIISVLRLAVCGALNFTSVQDLFISSIVLIVAAVPEGLPTIVAVSLALNMVKLAKENALIKKMSATETTGAVSVICSDKTGTLTENKMAVTSVCKNQFCVAADKITDQILYQNFVCNSTADLIVKGKKTIYKGSATEGALLVAFEKSAKTPYVKFRKQFTVIDRENFSSDKKYMSSTLDLGNIRRTLIKGAPEVVLSFCDLTKEQSRKILNDIKAHQVKGRRVLCFAHCDDNKNFDNKKCTFDAFVAISDPVRKDVYKAVSDCKKAGIKVKILTGDNMETALAVAKELKIADDDSQVINAKDIEKLSDEEFKKVLTKINVIARSTPMIKLRVVKTLKNMGEVVAVTGDGINDAPAIKHADVGIAMGINGSDITKEAADVVLLDDSFSTVVKAVSFGRNVYKNLQRFILFQLSVNLSALLFITVCAVLGMPQPFNTLELLWINVIMDGPPALTLGLERESGDLMNCKPIQRSSGIVSLNMLFRILFNALFVGVVMIVQYRLNFLNISQVETGAFIFTLFILFQLFNAFNSRELGAKSIFSSIGKNKVMVATFAAVLIVHFIIVQFLPGIFGVNSLSILSWVKAIIAASSMIVVCEIFKFIYRIFKRHHKPNKSLDKM